MDESHNQTRYRLQAIAEAAVNWRKKMPKINVYYNTIDHYSKSGTFKTLKGARHFAQQWIGESPDIGYGYAVSFDGVGKITCSGCRLEDLFGPDPTPEVLPGCCDGCEVAAGGRACQYCNIIIRWRSRMKQMNFENVNCRECQQGPGERCQDCSVMDHVCEYSEYDEGAYQETFSDAMLPF